MQSYLDIRTPVNTSIPVLVAVGSKETPFARSMARKLVQPDLQRKGHPSARPGACLEYAGSAAVRSDYEKMDQFRRNS